MPARDGWRGLTPDGAAIVEAAHLESWAENGNDDIANGLEHFHKSCSVAGV